MHNTIEVIRDIRKRCTHEFEGGHVCASPALRGETFCYFHHPTRKPVANPHQRRARRQSFACQSPTNRAELQHALGQVITRIAANDIDLRRARLLLSALQSVRKTLTG